MSPDSVGPGAILGDGRYRIESALGTGGMASVWLAVDQQLDRQVAVKVISDTLALDDAFVKRFRREALIAAGLSHPNLVKVYDLAQAGERPFLVMELVDGGTLASKPGADAGEVARGMLAALDHIHAAGVVHRDIKPANVLFDRDGRPRLTDFGIAHPEDATHLTMTGQIIGTLKFMAPEVAAGHPATPRSDLFSLGVVLRGIEGAGPEVRRLVDALTQEDPDRRPRTARDALALLDGSPEQSPPTAPTQTLHRPRSRAAEALERIRGTARALSPRGRVILGVAAAVALIVLIAVLTSGGGGRSMFGPGARTTPATTTARPAAAPAGASLQQQLDALDRAVSGAHRP